MKGLYISAPVTGEGQSWKSVQLPGGAAANLAPAVIETNRHNEDVGKGGAAGQWTRPVSLPAPWDMV